MYLILCNNIGWSAGCNLRIHPDHRSSRGREMADGSLCHAVTRVCKLCGERKEQTEFYPFREWFDSYCKLCRCAYQRRQYRLTISARKAYERSRATLPHRVAARIKYASSDSGRASTKRAVAASNARYPEKRAARISLGNAVRDGIVSKQPCSVCGSTYRIHGHHEDYSKPLDVIWLCPRHHRDLHKNKSI